MRTSEHTAPVSGVALFLPPVAGLLGAVAVFAITAVSALWLATAQPWLGLVMHAGDDGQVVLAQMQREDLSPMLVPGARITRIGDIALRAQDIIEEPDTLPSYDALNAFLARQAALTETLAQPEVSITWSVDGGRDEETVIAPYPGRPAWSLPVEFWLQLFVGGAGAIIGGWVWALKRDRPSLFFALSGFGLMLSAVSASVYGTRELALGALQLQALAAGNYLGTNAFGLALISLLMVYPQRIGKPWAIAAVWAVGLGVVGGHLTQMMPAQAIGSYGPMLVQFIAILALILAQLFLSRRVPLAQAALGWFGLSILLGTGVFVFMIAVPVLLGVAPLTSQAHAFGIILLIYCGLAIGVARYRLFDLGLWAFRLISYLLGGVILVGLDAVLIYVVSIERIPAFGLALLAVAFLYLPLRSFLAGVLSRRSGIDPSRFRDVFDIALSRNASEQERRWRALLDTCFAPLSIDRGEAVSRVELMDGGQQMLVPATSVTPPLTMRYARGGRRLFSQADADWLQQLFDLMEHALMSRDAHERGARQERTRMARDLHDNIGAQLLRALHSQDSARKDTIITETLTDLRDIINNAQGTGMTLSEILAELRFETDDRLSAVGIALDWQTDVSESRVVDARLAHTLRSIVREATSNTIRHAQASRFVVGLEENGTGMHLKISDDGIGTAGTDTTRDGGLVNMAARAEGHGGTLRITSANGTHIEVCIPVEATPS